MAIDPKSGNIKIDDERYVLDTVTTRIAWLSLGGAGYALLAMYSRCQKRILPARSVLHPITLGPLNCELKFRPLLFLKAIQDYAN